MSSRLSSLRTPQVFLQGPYPCCVCKCDLSSTQSTASQRFPYLNPTSCSLRNSSVSIFNTAHRCFMLQCFSLPLNTSMGRAEVLAALFSISFQQWARNNWTNACRKNKSGSPALGHNKVIGNRFVFLLWKSLNQKLNYMGQAGRLIPTWNKAYDWLSTSQISNLHDWEKNPEGIGNVWE